MLNSKTTFNFFNFTKFYKHFINIFGVNIVELNTSRVIQGRYPFKLTLLTSHQQYFEQTQVQRMSFEMTLLPITTFFEKDYTLINLEGRMQPSLKVLPAKREAQKDVSAIVRNYSFYLEERSAFIAKRFAKVQTTLAKNSNITPTTNLKSLNSRFDYNVVKNHVDFYYQNQQWANYVKFNKNKYLFSFFLLSNTPKFYNKKVSLFTYKNHNNISNFYTNSMLTNASPTLIDHELRKGFKNGSMPLTCVN